jgi:DNA-binding PadR family transcriptional regulator
MRLKPSAYLILGMLTGGIKTGYAIKRTVDQSTRFFWAVSLSQVYPELARLEQDGYVTGSDDPQGARPRRVYRVTEKGGNALAQWLADERLPEIELRDEGLLRLFFADLLSAEDRLALVKRLRGYAEQADRSFREEIVPLAEAPDQHYRSPRVVARLGADYYAWRAAWFARLEDELTSERPPPARATRA